MLDIIAFADDSFIQARPPCIPPQAAAKLNKRKEGKMAIDEDNTQRRLEIDIQRELGADYSVDLKSLRCCNDFMSVIVSFYPESMDPVADCFSTQRTSSSRSPSGTTTTFLKSSMARTLLTSLISTFWR